MSWGPYNEFLEEAKELYGFSHYEAQEFYRAAKGELDEVPTVDDIYRLEVYEEEVEEPYREPVEVEREPALDYFDDLEAVEWDFDDVEDYWLEEGEEIEITLEWTYGETE